MPLITGMRASVPIRYSCRVQTLSSRSQVPPAATVSSRDLATAALAAASDSGQASVSRKGSMTNKIREESNRKAHKVQETPTAKEDVHLGHCVAEAFGSAAQSGGLLIVAFLQVFILGNMFIAISPNRITGSDCFILFSLQGLSGGNSSISLGDEAITDSRHGSNVGQMFSLKGGHF